MGLAAPPGYGRLPGAIPLLYAPGMGERASEVRRYLEAGAVFLSEILDAQTPRRGVCALEALLIADRDWEAAPRENEHAYPPGLPYFTRSVRPPVLVLPETLSPAIRPHTGATLPLTVWHELAHAFLLQKPLARTPAWLREFVPQTASSAVARRTGLPLEGHLDEISRDPGFTVRGFRGRANAKKQMAFQNLLLLLGVEALEEFGEGFLRNLARALREERGIVDERRAGELLAEALGPGGREWLGSRPEF